MKVQIMVDSTVDLTPELEQRLDMVPLSVHFGEEEYLDGVTITRREFYENLIESDVMPTTSQATPHAFGEAYKKAFAAGCDQIVVVTISCNLSGTYQSACIAAEDYPGKVFVVDSHSVTIGATVLVEYGLRLADQGCTGEEIAKELEQKRDRVHLVALLDTLEYLKKGGRISKSVALAGSLLSIKPVVSVENGEILMLGKARGSKQGSNLLTKEIQKAGGVDFRMPVMLGYTGLSDQLLVKYAEDSGDLWKGQVDHLDSTCVGSVVGTHAGPGAVAVAFFQKN